MPSLRSTTATAVAFAPMPSLAEVEPVFTPAPEGRGKQQEISRVDRRTPPARENGSVVFAIDHPRRANAYTKVVDLALVLACLAIFVGVLAVGLVG